MIGQTIWIFDLNRRVYSQSGKGGPIWREYWRPHIIVGETSRSWVLDTGLKISKTSREPRSVAFSKEEIDRQEYIHEKGYKIAELVQFCKDYDKLKAIESILERN